MLYPFSNDFIPPSSLIVIAIIPGTVKPIISLILLGIILGIPGLLIVLTSRKVSYLGWMIVYILSLPVWNFVLPLYAFLHMVRRSPRFQAEFIHLFNLLDFALQDDFSW